MPMASTSPNKVRLFSEKADQLHDRKVPTSDTATSITGRSSAFQSCRNNRTTTATRNDRVAERIEHFIHGFADEWSRGRIGNRSAVRGGSVRTAPASWALTRSAVSRALAPGKQKDAEARRWLAVQPRHRFLAPGAQLGPADVFEVGDFPIRAGLEDELAKLLGLDQPAERAHCVLEILAVRDRRLADLPGRHLHVLLAQNPDHVAGRQVPRLQLVRVEPNAKCCSLAAR